MLDWLSSDQRASYAESSQILDAPETPAPLFAYRALKSVLFGSYDDEDGNDNEKENIPLETRPSQVSVNSQRSPLKPKSSTPQRPTPRRMLSPAKSILRTPGIPTPRRQNVSVKFKDVKQTLMNLSTVTEGQVSENKGNLQPPAIMPSESTQPTEQAAESTKRPQGPNAEAELEVYYNVREIDAYIAVTEREMKKLVRYGQRMREYARLSQKENATLKRELEIVRKENEMLRCREGPPINQEKAGKTRESNGLFDISPPKHIPKAASQSSPEDGPERAHHILEDQAQHPLHPDTAEKKPGNQSSTKVANTKTKTDCISPQPKIAAPIQRASNVNSYPADNTRMASKIQLPPDRLAAAKARLRMKSEERKKALSMNDQVQKEDHGSSLVDWQDL
ncbi:hypothetical protein EPUS_04905 [Endocarpon pusillum Z07020]|uniref:Spindle pole body-associated protein cut12 domain-containing protein n=1 Tax=Endocarpon pusillum (strain Z07020 / HMAS-L-300199) TaxID=1263415 RepID=U1GRX4_ENDPU|nr:uncharacterized protein EPUS_04905 [Endocarpon pusillum Z07020]ERF74736.1 hypothetical protein EPUS_04905 [Endocarpon pusillum Z07020]